MPRSTAKQTAPRAADLLEEAVHLLRRHPQELGVYYATSAPFAVALVYFWSYIAWFAPADGEVAAGALFLALTFGLMKAGQNRFALRMRDRRVGAESARWTMRDWLAEAASQFRLQATGIVLVPLAAVFGVPFAWVYSYYQNATALPREQPGEKASRHEQAVSLAQLWPAQNHWVLLILSVLWLMVYLNLAVAFYAVPALAHQWLGLRTGFALQGWAVLNSTFLALVATLTHLLVDPLIKTYFVLRVFHGRARHTGADLRLILGREQLRRRLAMGLSVVLLVALLGVGTRSRAAEPAPTSPPAQTAPVRLLDPALDRVLEQPEFRWRLHPLPAPPGKEKPGIIKGFVQSTFDVIKQIFRTMYQWFEGFRRWVADLLPGGAEGAGQSSAFGAIGWMAILQWVAYVLIVVVVGLLLFVAWKVWAHNRGVAPVTTSVPLPTAVPDLRDEQIEASRLPTEGWLDLARAQMAAGEWRLALRALFLATLARHAREGLLSLAKFKTNHDYETELRRRVRSRTEVVEEFRGRRQQFEEVWYGAMPASDTLVRDWLRRMEGTA